MSIMSMSNWKLHLGLVCLFLVTVVVVYIDDLVIEPMCHNSYSVQKPSWVQHVPDSFENFEDFENNFNNFSSSVNNNSSKKKVRVSSITNRSLYTPGDLQPPAVYLRLKGGLGNQLFQYACHYALARKNNWPLYTWVSKTLSKADRKFQPWERDFALDFFRVPLFKWNTVDESWNVSTNINYFNDSVILSGLYPEDKVLSQSGGDYCISEAFFSPYKQDILQMFTPKAQPNNADVLKWMKLMDSVESVAVHFRRRDFLPINVSVPISYHKDAMKRITQMLQDKPPTFFIFSDDVDFVTAEFKAQLEESEQKNGSIFDKKGGRMYLVSQSKLTSMEEFFLLSKCKHDIIPNSSFGWWAAYLNPNPNKIIIAAHQNLNLFNSMFETNQVMRDFNKYLYRHMYYPIDWITVDPFA